MLYVVGYVGGTYGNGLCHFINQHINFYSTSITSHINEEEVSGAYAVDNNLNIFLSNSSNVQINDVKKYNIAVRIKCDAFNDHIMIDNYEKFIEQKLIKIILVAPTNNIIKNVEKRNIHSPRAFNKNSPQVIRAINFLKELKLKYTHGKEYYCIDIDDLFSWVYSDEIITKNYVSLCKFLNTEIRPTYKRDIDLIIKRTNYGGKFADKL